jgi:hypothetical protein
MLTLISSLLFAKSTHLLTPFHYSPHTQFTFLKLTTFVVVELFFIYNLPIVKTLCDLTSFCCYKTPPSHTHKRDVEQTQKERKKERKKKKRENKE